MQKPTWPPLDLLSYGRRQIQAGKLVRIIGIDQDYWYIRFMATRTYFLDIAALY